MKNTVNLFNRYKNVLTGSLSDYMKLVNKCVKAGELKYTDVNNIIEKAKQLNQTLNKVDAGDLSVNQNQLTVDIAVLGVHIDNVGIGLRKMTEIKVETEKKREGLKAELYKKHFKDKKPTKKMERAIDKIVFDPLLSRGQIDKGIEKIIKSSAKKQMKQFQKIRKDARKMVDFACYELLSACIPEQLYTPPPSFKSIFLAMLVDLDQLEQLKKIKPDDLTTQVKFIDGLEKQIAGFKDRFEPMIKSRSHLKKQRKESMEAKGLDPEDLNKRYTQLEQLTSKVRTQLKAFDEEYEVGLSRK